jgi:N-acetylgalactosamine kinase
MGYGVLPMAIDMDTLIAASFATSETHCIVIHNVDSIKFPTKTIPVDSSGVIAINRNEHHWTNYVLCGIKGALEHSHLTLSGTISFVVDGTVPIGSGLSSSAALVCSSLLATSKLFDIELSREELASLAAKSERFTGVESGGMDQAISFLAEKGFAKFVNFDPITTSSVSIPKGYMFVVADSNVASNKKETAETNYNMRVIECRLGCAILGKALNVTGWNSAKTLKKFQEDMKLSLGDMILLVKKHLKVEAYSIDEILKILEMNKNQLFESYFKSSSGGVLKTTGDHFKLFDRVYHVYSESNRVEEFIEAAHGNNVEMMGNLMDSSHFSLRDHYEASCNELEELTKICRKAGALGSRLTGAGWGGATVSLVKESHVQEFIQQVVEKFYKGKYDKETIFASAPSSGATIFKK